YVREAVALSRRINGEGHPDTLTYTHNLGSLLDKQNRPADAEPYLRAVAEKCDGALGNDHPITLSTRVTLGSVLSKLKHHEEALERLTAVEPTIRRSATPYGKRLLYVLLRGLGRAK